jgi:hypothetical protein
VSAGGGECTLTLDQPVPAVLVEDSDHAEAIASPFRNVQAIETDVTSVVGIPTYPATVGKYLWLLTRGIGWVAPQADVSVGSNNRQVVFRHDGSIDTHTYNDATVATGPHAGFAISNLAAGTQAAPFVKFDI